MRSERATNIEAVSDTAEVLDPADPITKTVDVHQQTSEHLLTNQQCTSPTLIANRKTKNH